MKQHENYRQLIWTLAKTDFKLRYQGSILGYIWAILSPLLMFSVLYVVFSSIFNPRNPDGVDTYALELLVSLMLYSFFSEGTGAGLSSLLSKSSLVTKTYIPRWTIIVASTLNAAMVYGMNLLIIVFFFSLKKFMPDWEAIGLFVLYSFFTYILILAFSLFTAPLYVKLRDLAMIWAVLLRVMMYTSPIIYPLDKLPAEYHKIILLNPIAFIIHFNKQSLLHRHYAELSQYLIFIIILVSGFIFSIFMYRRNNKKIAEEI